MLMQEHADDGSTDHTTGRSGCRTCGNTLEQSDVTLRLSVELRGLSLPLLDGELCEECSADLVRRAGGGA